MGSPWMFDGSSDVSMGHVGFKVWDLEYVPHIGAHSGGPGPPSGERGRKGKVPGSSCYLNLFDNI